MAIAVAIKSPLPIGQPTLDSTQSTQVVRGTLTFSGSYTAGGDSISFAVSPVQSNQRPIRVIFWEEPAAGTLPTSLTFHYRNTNASPNVSNGVLQITAAGTVAAGVPTAGAEISAAAYPALLTGAKVWFEATFALGI